VVQRGVPHHEEDERPQQHGARELLDERVQRLQEEVLAKDGPGQTH